jgi:CheY-like chemotaxis protein
LSITKKLVERMGGRIWVESEEGKGSRFHVSLPLRSAATAFRAPVPSNAAPDATTDGGRILLADDSEDNRTLFGYYLRNTRYALDLAEDGQRALVKFQDGAYDLVLMDLQMPILDGNAAVRGIRDWEKTNSRPATPILMLTAQAEDRVIAQSHEAGCSGFLTKPVTKDQLLTAIHRYTQPARA